MKQRRELTAIINQCGVSTRRLSSQEFTFNQTNRLIMRFYWLIALLTAILATQPMIVSSQEVPLPLDSIYSVLRRPGVTTLQIEALAGKLYTGTVKIKDVINDGTSEQPKPKAIVELVIRDHGYDYYVMNFKFRDNIAAAALLKGQSVKLTARLRQYWLDKKYINITTETFDFVDAEIISPTGQ